MHYEGSIIRPPSEADSIILQATVGCAYNRCTFCAAYKEKRFRIKQFEEIEQDLDFAAKYCRRQKTLFLADGDALVIPQDKLVKILTEIRRRLPWVRRVSLYGNCRDILARTREQLTVLKNLGLGRIYMGLESGHDLTLDAIRKGVTPEDMIRAGQRVRQANIFLSVSCLLGIAGRKCSLAHARETALVLNRMQPSQIAVLTLMPMENTELGQRIRDGERVLPSQQELFSELRCLVAGLGPIRTQFQANHASNYFNLNGRLPKDKERFLQIIDRALDGTLRIKPEQYRAL